MGDQDLFPQYYRTWEIHGIYMGHKTNQLQIINYTKNMIAKSRWINVFLWKLKQFEMGKKHSSVFQESRWGYNLISSACSSDQCPPCMMKEALTLNILHPSTFWRGKFIIYSYLYIYLYTYAYICTFIQGVPDIKIKPKSVYRIDCSHHIENPKKSILWSLNIMAFKKNLEIWFFQLKMQTERWIVGMFAP